MVAAQPPLMLAIYPLDLPVAEASPCAHLLGGGVVFHVLAHIAHQLCNVVLVVPVGMPLIFVLEFETAVYDEAPRTWVKRVRQHVQYRRRRVTHQQQASKRRPSFLLGRFGFSRRESNPLVPCVLTDGTTNAKRG